MFQAPSRAKRGVSSGPNRVPLTAYRPAPNQPHSLKTRSQTRPVVTFSTVISPRWSTHVRPTRMLCTRLCGGYSAYTSPKAVSVMRVRPTGKTSILLPMNLVRGALVMSYVQPGPLPWAAPMGG